MGIKFAMSTFVTGVLGCVSANGYGQSLLDSLATAVSEGKTSVSMRYRYESVEQDNALKDASASTLRTRITFNSGTVNGFSALLEADNVTTLGPDDYDSFVLDKYRGQYSVIADAVGTEINQALVRYKPDDTQTWTLGNQRIQHAGQRFVGGVAWRQNEQTFDALSYQRRTATLDLDYSYLWNVNRIFGAAKPSVQRTNLDSDSHIALASFKTDAGNIGAYLYALDFADAAGLSSVTYGVSWGKQIDKFSLNASLAMQSDYGDNPTGYDATYLNLDLGYNFGPASLLIGYEQLGSDDGKAAFATPLATLHKWQGWTDLFLNTPAVGIEDTYITLAGKLGKASLSATYHDLAADEGGASFGKEWDLVASYPLHAKLSAELKYASYDRDSFAVDTDKLWFSLNLAF